MHCPLLCDLPSVPRVGKAVSLTSANMDLVSQRWRPRPGLFVGVHFYPDRLPPFPLSDPSVSRGEALRDTNHSISWGSSVPLVLLYAQRDGASVRAFRRLSNRGIRQPGAGLIRALRDPIASCF
jgi:hypothetical protein